MNTYNSTTMLVASHFQFRGDPVIFYTDMKYTGAEIAVDSEWMGQQDLYNYYKQA